MPSLSRPLHSEHVLDGPVKATRVADRLPWRELYEAHAAELAGYLLRLTGDREVASDLMQETFVVGMRDESALREPASARAWLYTIASRLGTKWLRRRRIIAFLPFLDTDRDPQDALDVEAIAVREALRAISPDQAVALVLHYAQGFTRGEIAELTGRSDEAIKSRIARGRRAFLAAYGRRGGGG
ncbi:MAG: RNA polymerase sigma factor [Chloroflexi bacterium]|nr:MAG: RNA polymerase sigma factor [Chloroflexota bacterium]